MTRRYFNRELSWLQFNHRVLSLAMDDSLPLLERVRFVSIFSSNLDEFFMKRVGYLKNIVEQGIDRVGPDDLEAQELLTQIKQDVVQSNLILDNYYRDSIVPSLEQHGIFLVAWKDLNPSEVKELKHYFKLNIFPVLTPLAVDPAHPFPFLSNLSVSLGVKLRYPKNKEHLFARIKIPEMLPQWVRLDNENKNVYRFVRLEDIVRNNLKELFPEMNIDKIMSFRITRSAEMNQVEDDADDLLQLIEEGLKQRRMGQVIRLEYNNHDPDILELIKKELELEDDDIYQTLGELDYTHLNQIVSLPIPSLKYQPWVPVQPKIIPEENQDWFKVLAEKDILVHHPYESFTGSVERFLKAAVDDPNVMAIKMTIYRAGEHSSMVPLLIRAAEAGKQVVCVIEVKARFDEARNMYWADLLEKAGAHVTYGIVGLKTHCKLLLVVRKEGPSFKFYSHIGTGNYNAETSKLYIDLGLFTSNHTIGSEVIETFNYLTGLSMKKNYRDLLIAPITMRDKFLGLIENEIQCHQKGQPARIIAKMNSLEDHQICEALYRASQEGVPMELIVRGFCCLVPGVPGMSENITVRSILGRFLEHSRIFYFRGGAKTEEEGSFFMGSADWMYRNLNARVEVITPLLSSSVKKACWEILQLYMEDTQQSWFLGADGSYSKKYLEVDPPRVCMDEFMALYKEHSQRWGS